MLGGNLAHLDKSWFWSHKDRWAVVLSQRVEHPILDLVDPGLNPLISFPRQILLKRIIFDGRRLPTEKNSRMLRPYLMQNLMKHFKIAELHELNYNLVDLLYLKESRCSLPQGRVAPVYNI